ncbi:hypothetical protein F3Y22_tig00110303pilonHSYRG00245 [Hibiscus syriacus]|uniref:Uncharacterized protein n=1 Tax=Hibiscus syriacus TaxID=106335 RepID=A0A6A3B243_HIBSY|nr:hypothetical protein F3Y22_tig00110303pilonHSYRG00245 [Hibiscus syriacus]
MIWTSETFIGHFVVLEVVPCEKKVGSVTTPPQPRRRCLYITRGSRRRHRKRSHRVGEVKLGASAFQGKRVDIVSNGSHFSSGECTEPDPVRLPGLSDFRHSFAITPTPDSLINRVPYSRSRTTAAAGAFVSFRVMHDDRNGGKSWGLKMEMRESIYGGFELHSCCCREEEEKKKIRV